MLELWLALVFCSPPEPAQMELTAERLLHDGKREISVAEGRAKLRSPSTVIDAERIIFDRSRNVATAMGQVVARISEGGKVAVVADLLTVVLDDEQQVRELYLYDGRALSKTNVSTEVFLAASTTEAVEHVGVTQALLEGNHLVRDGSRWTVEQLELVPCECDFKNPSWSITSSTATIDTEAERVSITNPVFKVMHIPVLWLPWLSLPLNDRQSGLLSTRPDFTPQNGFILDQPVFLTLGRSADITLTPGLLSGGRGLLGVAGPRLSTEFRYVPSSRAAGRALLGLLYDFRNRRDVEKPDLRAAGTQRGLRGELSWQHTQDFDHGLGARADVNVHSDGDYNRDLTVDVIATMPTYLRSSISLSHRGVDHSLGLDVGLRQDIQWGYDLLGRGTLIDPARSTGPFGPGTLQRFPALTFGWAPSGLMGPLRFEVEADAVRLWPLFSPTGDEGGAAAEGALLAEPFARGVDRLFTPGASSAIQHAGLGDRQWQLGEREARDRLMVFPRLSMAVQPAGLLSISAFVAWRQLVWMGEASGRTWSRGYPLLGARLETEWWRNFSGGSLRHVIQPVAELRAVPVFILGSAGSTVAPPTPTPVAYDAVDAAVADLTPRFQGVLELRQRLARRGGVDILRLDIGQGFELSGPALSALRPVLGESFGRMSASVGWVSAQGTVRIDPVPSRLASDGTTTVATGGLTRIGGRVDLDDGGGHGAYAAYENLLMEGTARSRQPLDLLFLIDRGFTSSTPSQQLVFGARWNFGPVSLRYDALVAEQTFREGPRLALAQHSVGLALHPACDCWRVDVVATQQTSPEVRVPSVGANITVTRFGAIGRR